MRWRESAGNDLSMPFSLEGVAGMEPAAPGIAARCHPQLMLEVKTAQNEKKELGGEPEEDAPPQGVGELGEGPGGWDGC